MLTSKELVKEIEKIKILEILSFSITQWSKTINTLG